MKASSVGAGLVAGIVLAVASVAAGGAVELYGPPVTGTNSGDVTLGAVGSTPSSNGASLSGQVLTLQPASSTKPGVVSAVAQTMTGAKNFDTGLAAPYFTGTQLAAPTAGTFATCTGTLTASTTYYYRVSTTNAVGESTAFTEVSKATGSTGATRGVSVVFTVPAGATGAKVYGRSTGAELLIATMTGLAGGAQSYCDDGSVTPSGALPSANTTGTSVVDGAFTATSATLGGNCTVASSSITCGTTITAGNLVASGGNVDCAGGCSFRNSSAGFAALGSLDSTGTISPVGGVIFGHPTIPTCGASNEGYQQIVLRNGANPTKVCYCTNNAGTYLYCSTSLVSAGTVNCVGGNTTTCP